MKTALLDDSNASIASIIDYYELSKGDNININTETEIAWIEKELYDLNDISDFTEAEYTEESNTTFVIKEEKNFTDEYNEIIPCIVGTLYMNSKQLYPHCYAILPLY
ncbi:MAG: hypothetical protein RSE41_01075 [Clostridia bacterium]